MKVTGYLTAFQPWLPTTEDATQRMDQLIRYMDDPHDPECDFETLALVMSLRAALFVCAEVLVLHDQAEDNRMYEIGQLYVARKVVHSIVQQLMEHMPQGPKPLREEG